MELSVLGDVIGEHLDTSTVLSLIDSTNITALTNAKY